MTENNHQRAKAVFSELIDQPIEKRAALLLKLCAGDADLEKEVTSLLEFHTVRSLMAATPAPKIRTRATLSTTRFDKPLLQRAGEFFFAATPLLIVLSAVSPLLWLVTRMGNEYNLRCVAEQLDFQIEQQAATLEAWFSEKTTAVQALTTKPSVRALIDHFLSDSSRHEGEPVFNHDTARYQLRQAIEESLGEQVVYCLLNRDLVNLAFAPQVPIEELSSNVGQSLYRNKDVVRAINGELTVRFPNPTRNPLPPPFNSTKLAICGPVKNEDGRTLAVLIIQCDDFDTSLSSMLAKLNSGDSFSESYLVNASGELLSEPRHPEYLLQLNSALTQSTSRSTSAGLQDKSAAQQKLLVRDPGAAILDGESPQQHSASWRLTRAADALIAQQDGRDVSGYRNYVGQTVVGAWRWLPTQRIGLVLELPKVHACRFAADLKRLMLGVFALSLCGGLIGLIVGRPRRRPRQLRSVGPYQIQELIGEGGMGKVYLAEHSLLCRPTAVKILTREKAELSVLARFEREVQLASQLTHPNTIAIYDFGRNEEGIFYYAMEYVDGGHIGQLVEFNGPLPGGRCIYLVRQLCFALREAHLAGVVHRDIKPQNVMVCDRGGEPDFIKLVDYGLVKAFVAGISDSSTQTNIIMGTPRFMAPERLQSPWLADPRVDIYSIGCLLYYMLTGELPPLVAPTTSQDPVQLSAETLDLQTQAVPFGALLSMCMSYDPAARPSSVASLLHELDVLATRFPWSRDDSETWWKQRGAKFRQFLANKREKAEK